MVIDGCCFQQLVNWCVGIDDLQMLFFVGCKIDFVDFEVSFVVGFFDNGGVEMVQLVGKIFGKGWWYVLGDDCWWVVYWEILQYGDQSFDVIG